MAAWESLRPVLRVVDLFEELDIPYEIRSGYGPEVEPVG